MTLRDLIHELRSIEDKHGDCRVTIANDKTNILGFYTIDRVCFFKDGDNQVVIIVEE